MSSLDWMGRSTSDLDLKTALLTVSVVQPVVQRVPMALAVVLLWLVLLPKLIVLVPRLSLSIALVVVVLMLEVLVLVDFGRIGLIP